MRLAIFGVGMYSTGRQTDGIGTIFPAAFQCLTLGKISEIVFFASSIQSELEALERLKTVCRNNGIDDDLINRIKNSRANEEQHSLSVSLSSWSIDAAIVATPDDKHFEILDTLCSHGIPSLCVKPLTSSYKEARNITAKFKDNNVLGLVEFHKRFDTANQLIKREFDNGKIGDLYRINVDYAQPSYIPLKVFKDWVGKTNIFQYLGVHYVDQIYFVTGFKPVRVRVFPVKGDIYKEIKSYDQVNVVIQWEYEESTFDSFHMTSWAEVPSSLYVSKQSIEYVGSKGRVFSDQSNRGLSILNDSGYSLPNPYFTQDIKGTLNPVDIEGYGVDSVKYFIESVSALKSGEKSLEQIVNDGRACTFESALISMSVIDAVNRCLEEGLVEAPV